MNQQKPLQKTIVIFSKNTPLSSLLYMVLAKNSNLRVRQFEDEKSLIQYMNIATIDLLIYDCEQIDTQMITSIYHLRQTSLPQTSLRPVNNISNSKFQLITLCKTISKGVRSICRTIGIDEIIIKPMSPIYLETRVLMRINLSAKQHSQADNYSGKYRRQSDQIPIPKRLSSTFTKGEMADNIIPLFGSKNKPAAPEQLH